MLLDLVVLLWAFNLFCVALGMVLSLLWAD